MLDTLNDHSILNYQPSEILYVYEHPQKEFNYIRGVTFLQGWSSPKLTVDYMSKNENGLLLVDDAADTHFDPTFLRNFYLKHSHHLKWSIMTIVHSFHDVQVPFLRSISLNTHYCVFFNSPQSADSIATFASQRFRLNKSAHKAFLELYTYIMSRPYEYLLVDLHPACRDKRLLFRTALFYPTYGNGDPITVFVPNHAK